MNATSSRTAAIEQLEALGLSAYAARTYVALVSLGGGTARDVDAVSDVPRTRVYDAAEELRETGLVTVDQSSPRRFEPVSSSTVQQRFTHEYTRRIETLVEALDDLDTTDE